MYYLPWLLLIIVIASFTTWIVYLKKSNEKFELYLKRDERFSTLFSRKSFFKDEETNVKAKLKELKDYGEQKAPGWSIRRIETLNKVLLSEFSLIQEMISEIETKIKKNHNASFYELNRTKGDTFSYKWLDEAITNTKQKYQNAVDVIKIIDCCNIKQSYQQGSITEEMYTQLLKTYKNLQSIINSTPKILIVLENERLKILKINKKNESEGIHYHISDKVLNDPELNDAKLCKKRFNQLKTLTLEQINNDLAQLQATLNSYTEYILENSTISEHQPTILKYQSELPEIKNKIEHLKFTIEDGVELEEFCITKLCEEYGYFDFNIYKMLYYNSENTDIQNGDKNEPSNPTTENKDRETELEQIENNIANLKQMVQNAVRDIGDVKPEDIEHAYTQGLITKEKFTEIMNSYEVLQFMIQSLPLQIETFEQKRLELLNK